MNGGIGGFAGPNDLGKPEATLGGYVSGWQGSKKATVEGSLVLTASALVRKKALVPGAQTAGSWGWTYEGEDGPHATIRYEADLRDAQWPCGACGQSDERQEYGRNDRRSD